MNLGVLTWVVPDGGSLALRRRSQEAFGRLGVGVWPILQTAAAASLAWFLASAVLGHGQPFFAAIAAVISTGVIVGQEGRRVFELVFGVACGLAVADLLVVLIGTGTVQIGVVVALAMAVAWLLGGGSALVSEAGVTALFTVMLDPSTSGWSPERFVDALLGAGVALGVKAVFPSDPRHLVERAAHPIFDDLVGALEETAAALRERDLGRAERALQRAREMDGRMDAFREAIDAGYDTARLSPPRRRALGQLGLYATAADQLDLAVRNVRVLARAAAATVREGETVPEALSETILDLARAVETLSSYIEEPEHPVETRGFALEAAGGATAVLEERSDLRTSMLVGQVRSTAVDLLRAAGMDSTEAHEALRESANRTTHEPTKQIATE
ncbi:aromatic acid exporter family protein [soil metagenome]